MKLVRLHIENFGKFSNFDYNFNENLNVILKENGWGKTTLSAFIKAMLFGFNTTNPHGLDKNDRKKYMPWNGMVCGGSLVIEVKGNNYRIERTFFKKSTEDTCVIYDLKTNKVTDIYNENIGEQILGINADSFERSVYIPQKELEIEFNSDIAAKLSDLIGGSNDTKSFDEAIKRLDIKIKELKRNGNKGLIAEENEKLALIEQEIINVKEQLDGVSKIDEKVLELEKEINKIQNDKDQINQKLDLYHQSIKIKEQKKTIERIDNSILQSQNKIEELKAMFVDDFNETDLEDVKEKIISRDLINNNINSTINESTDEAYSHFIDNGKIDEEKLAEIEKYCVNRKSNRFLFIFRYYIVPAILVTLMATLIVLTFTVDSFKESGVGIVISSICLIGIVTSTRSYNQASNKENNYLETLKKYGVEKLELSEIIKLKTLNENYEKHIKNLQDLKNKKEDLEKQKDQLNQEISNYLNKFDIDETDENKKVTEIYKIWWTIKTEKDNLKKLLLEKQDYIKENPIDEKLLELDIDGEKLKQKIKEIDASLFNLKKIKTEFEQKKHHIINSSDKIDLYIKQKEELQEEIKSMKYKLNVLTQTTKMLKTAQENLLSKYVKPMKDGLTKYLNILAKNKISDFNINTDFEINIIENGFSKEIGFFSKGYQQLISLCMRLALIDCLYIEEKPFIILDDPFVNYDNEKLTDTINLLKDVSKEIQIVYFTCHESRNI